MRMHNLCCNLHNLWNEALTACQIILYWNRMRQPPCGLSLPVIFVIPYNAYSGLTGLCQLKWESLLMKGVKHKRCSIPSRRTKFIQAVAIPVAPPSEDSVEYRKQIAESYGFKQIGEPLPENVTMKDIIDSLPKKVLFLFSSFCTLIAYVILLEPTSPVLSFGNFYLP